MSFDIIFLKKTGQIVRTGYYGDSLVLAKDEDKLSFDDWVEFHTKAVDTKKRELVDATAKTAFKLRGAVGDPLADIRAMRDDMLTRSDFMMMPDYPISPEYRGKVAAYRQALRDLTKDLDDPEKVVYPEFPVQN
ncbi:MAG: hypothetical protein EOP83_31345 [Verrucomicrobiaceae bacterium]|nr:MAG: hypothetical protein EOP83_31345 [Verrucomicrobiaceae bacterium]